MVKPNNSDPSVAIVIPVYKSELSVTEQASLRRCMTILAAYPVKIVAPRNLDLNALKGEYPKLDFIFFDEEKFSDIAAYNRLLTSVEFYRSFLPYQFILIYQLDA